jgi:glycosyltransferase involved in cell wall biosynthesis
MAERYTILQVITPHSFRGAERITAHYVRGLMDRGHRVVVASPGRVPAFLEYLEGLGIEHRALGIAGKINPLAAGRIAKLAREIGADLIHTALSTASLHGLRAARKVGVPGIGHVHAMSGTRWYQQATTVLCCSRGVADHLEREGLKVKDVRVVWNGVRVEEFENLRSAEEMRKELGVTEGARVIGAVAGLSERKGLKYLVEAVGLLGEKWPELQCLVAGGGELRQSLEAQAKALGVAGRVHVLPATGIEGFALVILEAAMLGVPSVATALPGIEGESLVRDETGLLVPPRDAKALADAIDRLLGDEGLRRKLGEAARERTVGRFTIERMAEEIEAVYRDVVGR